MDETLVPNFTELSPLAPGAEASTEPAVIGADAAEVWKLPGRVWMGLLTWKICRRGACNAPAPCATPCGAVQPPGVEERCRDGQNKHEEAFFILFPLKIEMDECIHRCIIQFLNLFCILLYHLYSYV